jgi:hypothetical protein
MDEGCFEVRLHAVRKRHVDPGYCSGEDDIDEPGVGAEIWEGEETHYLPLRDWRWSLTPFRVKSDCQGSGYCEAYDLVYLIKVERHPPATPAVIALDD